MGASVALVIGDRSLVPPVVLAPMAGITDAPFRVLCAEHAGTGQGLFVAEMVTARGLVEGNARSWDMIRRHPAETSRSQQLYGSDPAVLGEAVGVLVQGGHADHIDLNFGCPVAKVTRNGGGAALPARRRLLAAVVRAAVEAAGPVPVTVKMRMGLDDDRLTYPEAGRIAASEGAAAIALHARTAVQGYDGVARWSAIKRLREAVQGVPVLGNGDIWAASDALRMVRVTGCDGVVVGRGCLGRPWLFADLARAFAGKPPLGPPTLGIVADLARRHLDLALGWYGDSPATIRRFRKHLRWYLQGYAVGRAVHRQAGTVETAGQVCELLRTLDPSIEVTPDAVRAPRGRQGRVGRLLLPEGWLEGPEDGRPITESLVAVSGG